jgi:hypothetical protein
VRRLALACLATIAAADYVIHTKDHSWFAIGPLDHAAHLATAALLVDPTKRSRAWAASYLAGALLPDLDHVPLAFRDPEPGDPRPRSHSLLSVAPAALGSRPTAAGMLAHFARDLAFEPGVPLLWPLRRRALRVPYAAYAAVTVAAALLRPRDWGSPATGRAGAATDTA